MERARDLAAFRDDPVGRWLSGAGWLHFCAHEHLFGVVLFDRPGGADVTALVESLKVELGDGIAPHRSLVDASMLAGVDAAAFDLLHRYVRESHEALSQKVERLALVRPSGMEGAVVAGFFGVLTPPYPVEVFDDAAAALRWLREDDDVGTAIAAATEAASGDDPLRVALRARFLDDLAGGREVSPADAARALGLSERTLQRRLGTLGTSFSRELLRSRIELAKRRMLDTDDALTAIALDAGFRTAAHFSNAFRREEGVTPTAWRDEHRSR